MKISTFYILLALYPNAEPTLLNLYYRYICAYWVFGLFIEDFYILGRPVRVRFSNFKTFSGLGVDRLRAFHVFKVPPYSEMAYRSLRT